MAPAFQELTLQLERQTHPQLIMCDDNGGGAVRPENSRSIISSEGENLKDWKMW